MLDLTNIILWKFSTYLWALPLSALLAGTGLYLTVKLGFIQARGFGRSFHFLFEKGRDKTGELSYFQTISTVLSSTVGTGNVVGVATAITIGGPGAVLWMWLVALLGMATKYSECILAITYREKGPYGVRGGPMYYIENGMGKRYRSLALFFSACAAIAALGTGDMVQSNAVSTALTELLSPVSIEDSFYLKSVVGVVLQVAVGLVIVGGIRRIGWVASYLMPFMVITYVSGATITLMLNSDKVLPAFEQIFFSSFTSDAVSGGFAGGGLWLAIRMGVARGVFSNEAGLGSAPIAYATMKTDHPVKGGLLALLEPFVDTIVICTMTALIVITSGLWQTDLRGAALTSRAFETQLPILGRYIVPIALSLFAYTSIIGWYYYGEKGFEYLLGSGWIPLYKAIYLVVVLVGAVVKLDIVWNFADIANAFMALPNIVAVLYLSGVVKDKTEEYFRRERQI